MLRGCLNFSWVLGWPYRPQARQQRLCSQQALLPSPPSLPTPPPTPTPGSSSLQFLFGVAKHHNPSGLNQQDFFLRFFIYIF